MDLRLKLCWVGIRENKSNSSDFILLLPRLTVVSELFHYTIKRWNDNQRTGHIYVINDQIAWLYVDTKQSLDPITGH